MLTDDDFSKIETLKGKGYSQQKIASELNISRASVARYWNGQVNEPVTTLKVEKVKAPLIDSLQEDLAVHRLQFEIQKAEAMRHEWQARQHADRQTQTQSEVLTKVEIFKAQTESKLKLAAAARAAAVAEAKDLRKREILQAVKYEIFPLSLQQALPANIVSQILMAIELRLAKLDILSLPQAELIFFATAIRDEICRTNLLAIQTAFQNWGRKVALGVLDKFISAQRRQILADHGQNGLSEYDSVILPRLKTL